MCGVVFPKVERININSRIFLRGAVACGGINCAYAPGMRICVKVTAAAVVAKGFSLFVERTNACQRGLDVCTRYTPA